MLWLILAALLSLAFKIAFFVIIFPILIGAIIIAITNAISRSKRKRPASFLWNILSVALTVFCTWMLHSDMFGEGASTGPWPFIILIVYGIVASVIIGVTSAHKAPKRTNYSEPRQTFVQEKSTSAHTNIRTERGTASYQQRKAPTMGDTYTSKTNTSYHKPYQSSRLSIVKRNLSVDKSVFEKYGIIFKYNLIEEYGTLQLNYELLNTNRLAANMSKDGDLILKVNVYDVNNNLLCIEQSWLDYSQLKSGYVADYFCFMSESMNKASSMWVYAAEPNFEDFD